MTEQVQDEVGQFELIYYQQNGFTRSGYNLFGLNLREDTFRDLRENPYQIVRFLDFNGVALWDRGEDTAGIFSLEGIVEGRTRIKFGRSLKTEHEYDAFLEKVREKSGNRYGNIHKEFDKGLRRVIRGEDAEFEQVYYDEAYCGPNFQCSAPDLEKTRYGEILVEDWINGGRLGRHYGFFFLGASERYIDRGGCDLTPEGCTFLGKHLGLKLSIIDASVLIKEGLLPPTEIVTRASFLDNGAVYHVEVPIKGPKLVIEPLDK